MTSKPDPETVTVTVDAETGELPKGDRPTVRRKLTIRDKTVQEQFLTFVRNGAPPAMAAEMIGYARATFKGWMRQAREGDPFFVQLERDFRQAFTIWGFKHINLLRQMAEKGSPTATMWLLERQLGEYFAPPKATVELSAGEDADGKSVPVAELVRSIFGPKAPSPVDVDADVDELAVPEQPPLRPDVKH